MTTNQHFKTHAGLMRYLLEEEGRRVRSLDNTMLVVGYKEGTLWDFRFDEPFQLYCFEDPGPWQPYEPKPWHVGVEPNTVLAEFGGFPHMHIGVFRDFDGHFYAMDGYSSPHCRPLTPEEVMKFHEAAVRVQDNVKG